MVKNMSKIYVNKREIIPESNRIDWVEFMLEILVGALSLMLASSLFKNFYISNIGYALIASIIIGALNVSLKPLLIYLTLPLNILTLGLTYPFVNVIILKITSLFLEKDFIIEGWMVPFFIAIFISVVSKILKELIVKPYKEGRY